VNTSDALSKLRVSEKPSQLEYSAGGDSEDSAEDSAEDSVEDLVEDSVEASLSIIVSFIFKNETILTLN
jgi:hypothetical protein